MSSSLTLRCGFYVIVVLLNLLDAAYALDHRYKSEKANYDSCNPIGVGDIETDEEAHIDFFFLADIERCEQENSIVIQHIVKNLHQTDALPFEWITGQGQIARRARGKGLPPGKADHDKLVANSYNEEEDHDAYIKYGSDLQGRRPAARWTEKEKPPALHSLLNELKTWYYTPSDDLRELLFIFSSNDKGGLRYDIELRPAELDIGFRDIEVGSSIRNAFLNAGKISRRDIHISTLVEKSSPDKLQAAGVPVAAYEQRYVFLSLGGEPFRVDVDGRAERVVSWSYIVLAPKGHPVTSGLIEVLVR